MNSDDECSSYCSEGEDFVRGGVVEDPEVWMDYWSEELVSIWHGLQEQCRAMGAAVLDRCDFPAFAQFCWERSSRRPPVV